MALKREFQFIKSKKQVEINSFKKLSFSPTYFSFQNLQELNYQVMIAYYYSEINTSMGEFHLPNWTQGGILVCSSRKEGKSD